MPHAHEHLTRGVDGGVYSYTTISDTTPAALNNLTAPVSTYNFYITDLIVTNSGTVLTSFVINGVSGQTISGHCAANGGGIAHAFSKPFKLGPGTVSCTLSATPTSGSVKVVLIGFWLPVANTN